MTTEIHNKLEKLLIDKTGCKKLDELKDRVVIYAFMKAKFALQLDGIVLAWWDNGGNYMEAEEL
jgi:hypothetical protein